MDRPSGTPGGARRLVNVSLAYLAWASVAAAVAIARDLPAGFAGAKSGLSAARDFAFGMGTALSPPLWWMAAQLVCVLLVARRGGRSRALTVASIAFGVSELVGAAGEPITLQLLRRPMADAAITVLQSGMIVLPLAIIITGAGSLTRSAPGGGSP